MSRNSFPITFTSKESPGFAPGRTTRFFASAVTVMGGLSHEWNRLAIRIGPTELRSAAKPAKPQPNRAKRLECEELAPAFE
jgi:hypothetical protein